MNTHVAPIDRNDRNDQKYAGHDIFILNTLQLPWKLLITCFLIVLSSGFMVSELYLVATTVTDRTKGISMSDITLSFHGDETKTKLKAQVLGPMKQYFSETQDVAALTPDDLKDIERVVAWNDSGALEPVYWDPKLKDKDKNPNSISRVLSNHGCFDCHSADATMKGNKKDSPLDTFAGISKFTKPDTGMSVNRLLMLSHVHLLGMGMMFLLSGAAVAATLWPTWVRCTLIVGGLSSVLIDIFGWWGVKWFGAPLAPVVMAGGMLMAACFGGSVLAAMYDLWIRPRPVQGLSQEHPVSQDETLNQGPV